MHLNKETKQNQNFPVIVQVVQLRNVWFGWHWTIVGYLMPNPFIHIYQIYDFSARFADNILKQVWAHFLKQLNGFIFSIKYEWLYLLLIICLHP